MKQADLRALKHRQRKAISTADKEKYSQQIAKTFLHSDSYYNTRHLAVYLALPEEVNTNTIIETAWADNKHVYLPVVAAKGQAMRFAPYFSDSTLTQDEMNIPVPNCNQCDYVTASELDTVIIPLVVFDNNTNRIGMGGGFYDRTFAFKQDNEQQSPQLIGIAFDIQRSHSPIMVANWDIPLNQVITEKAIYPS